MANTLRFKRGLVATIPTAVAGEPLFTTDTFDLYIGNGTTNTRFQKYIASGSSSQLLRGDGSLLTMPIVLTSPSNGQVLKYNGTNWVNDSDAGVTGSGTTNYLPKWTSSSALGNSLVYDDGNHIGIGTVSPDLNRKLHVYTTLSSMVGNMQSTTTGAYLGFTDATTTDNTYVRIGAVGNNAVFYANGIEQMRLTSTGLGIGTTSPATALHVLNSSQGVARFQSTQGEVNIALNNSSASGNLIGTIGAAFYLYSGGAERFRLDASGNLGLGVTPSAWSITPALQVVRASIYNQGDDGTYITSNGYYNAGWKYIGASTATQYLMLSGQHRWYTAPSGTAGNAITFTQAMTLNASGNLSIGNTNDTYKLDVTGTGRFSSDLRLETGASDSQIIFKNNASGNPRSIVYNVADASFTFNRTSGGAGATFLNTGAATFSSSVTATSFIPTSSTIPANGMYLPSANTLGFASGTSARMVITSTGAVGIGTTSPTGLFEVKGDGASYFTRGTKSILLNPNVVGADTNALIEVTSGMALAFGTGGAERLRITSGGNVGIGTTSPSALLHAYKSSGSAVIRADYNGVTTIDMTASSSGNAFISSNTTLIFENGSTFTERMRITSGGNVGIGTTSPSYPLEIASTNALSIAYQRTGVAAKKWGFQSDNDSTYWYNITDNVLALTVRNTGIIGIGTTSPAAKLHLVDSVESEIRTQYSTTSSGKLITGNGFTTIGSITNDPLVFVSNNTERMRLTNGGNLLLGSTSDTGEKFQVTGAGIVSGLFTVSGSTGIPATTATYIRFASGFASPDIGRMYIGDGSGWKFHMSKRLSSTTTDLITFFDNGSVQTSAPTGYAAKPYKLGEVLDGAVTIPTKSVAVEIDGTVYFLLASTTLP
jgi:hypothetical protein